MRRSMLFLPGNTPNIIQNGEILGADAVILDLEDAVAPTEKDSARILVRNAIKYMGFGKCEVIVRINAIDTDFWTKALDAIIPVKPSLIMPHKKSCDEDVKQAAERRLSEAKGEAEKIVANARAEAEREKNEIISSAQKEITGMVTGAVEKLALEQSASDAFDQFLDAAEEADHE